MRLYVLPVLLPLLLCGCRSSLPQLPEGGDRDGTAFLRQQLALLKSHPLPEGVAPQLWTDLKASLAGQLQARLDSGKTALGAPDSNLSQAQLTLDTPGQLLSWRYANQGDYDQNSEVNAADLVPLAQHFQEASGGGPFPYANVQSVIDGDNNGEINGADITPIAQNLGSLLASYNVYTSTAASDLPADNTAPNGAGASLLGTLAQADGTGDPKTVRISYSLPSGAIAAGSVFWVRPNDALDGSGADGTPSSAAGPGAPIVSNIQLFQLSFDYGDSNVYNDTDWGRVLVSFTGSADPLYFNMTFNGTQVLTDIPLLSTQGAGVPNRVSLPFSLGSPSGTAVGSGSASYSLSVAPKGTSRWASAENPYTIGQELVKDHLPNGSDVIFPDPPQPAVNDYGLTTPGLQGGGIIEAHHTDFDQQPYGDNEEAAAAVSDSLIFLKKKHNLQIGSEFGKPIDIPAVRLFLGEVYTAKSEYNGADKDWPTNKDLYMKANGYPIRTTMTNSVEEAYRAIAASCDVELIVQTIHSGKAYQLVAPITGIALFDTGNAAISIADYNNGSNVPRTETWVLERHTDTGFVYPKVGGFVNPKSPCQFVIECPVMAPSWQGKVSYDFEGGHHGCEQQADGTLQLFGHRLLDQHFYCGSLSKDFYLQSAQVSIDSTAGSYGPQCDSLLLADGTPALCYEQYGSLGIDNSLWYCRATDPGAQTWQPPVQLVTHPVNELGTDIDCQLVGGLPSVCYLNSTDMYTCQAQDSKGDAWNAPVLCSPPTYGVACRMEQYGAGQTALAFQGSGNLKILYNYNFTTGAADPPVTAVTEAADFDMLWNSGAVRHEIVFRHTSNGLSYSNSTDGTTWTPPIKLGGGDSAGWCLDAETINGELAVTSYYGQNDGRILYWRQSGGVFQAAPDLVGTAGPPTFGWFRQDLNLRYDSVNGWPVIAGMAPNGFDLSVYWLSPN